MISSLAGHNAFLSAGSRDNMLSSSLLVRCLVPPLHCECNACLHISMHPSQSRCTCTFALHPCNYDRLQQSGLILMRNEAKQAAAGKLARARPCINGMAIVATPQVQVLSCAILAMCSIWTANFIEMAQLQTSFTFD